MHLLKLVKLLLKRALHGQKQSSKGREVGDKTCMEFRPRKLNTLVKTRYICILFPTSCVCCLFIFHASWFHIYLGFFYFFLTLHMIAIWVFLFQNTLIFYDAINSLWQFRVACRLKEYRQFVKMWSKCCHQLWLAMCWIRGIVIGSSEMSYILLYPHVVGFMIIITTKLFLIT